MKLYNTLTRKKEEFVPLKKGFVRMYACGVTVYDYCHLGHARALITYDLLYRTLCSLGFKIVFVRNFTDIDDKIIDRAQAQKITYTELTEKFIKAFREDAKTLNLATPTHEPRATEAMPHIIKLIERLIKKDLAYQVGNDVFYHVRSFKNYGQLSQKNINELASGARVDVMETKRDPLDFALWKGEKPGEPSWESPWGRGRPGWHIECSAMSMSLLSDTFDIHCGGRDLIFPHHENEIAQSEGATRKALARFWIHNGFVNINAEKMSKSLGNFLTIRDVVKKYPAEVIRLFILSAHYRSPIDYNDMTIHNAAASLTRFYETKQRVEEFLKNPLSPSPLPQGGRGIKGEGEEEFLKFDDLFTESLNDDLNTAKVVGAVFDLVRLTNKALDEGRLTQRLAQKFIDCMAKAHTVLGLFGTAADVYLNELKLKGMDKAEISEKEVAAMIARRKEARTKKDFSQADQIRQELLQKGIELKDNPDGTTGWSFLTLPFSPLGEKG